MQLGVEIGYIVLGGDPAAPKRGTAPTVLAHAVKFDFTADLNGYPKMGHSRRSPTFRPMSIVAKRLEGLRCRLVWM